MNELLDLLNRLPRPLKYLGLVFLLMPLVYVLSRLLGVEKYWWVFALGILLIAVLLSLLNVVVSSREKRQARAFEGELRRDAQKPGASREEVKQALGDLSAKWTEAMTLLKQAGLDVYALPWYLLIGEPQSGKSTTLKNSGLEFPVGADALSGAGGTRNCDWWFANEAVILDTAGRFTFQEESAPDQAEWSSFLKLLHRYRKYCPINGVLVVIPCTSLLEDSPEEQERKAVNIRQKLLHVQRVLEIRFPVFILVTKADRVLGFSEFFLKLDPIDQQQLFGWSTPDGPTKPYDPESFDGVYEQIANRLYRLRLKFLGEEENPAQADKLYVFPEEFRALKAPLAHYFKTIFQRTRFDEPFAFRGFYFSSGVQQGRPIAQASRDLLDVPGGAGEGVLENLESLFKKARAFFIRHFYEKKVFPEQGLITRTAAAEARQRKVLWTVRVLGILAILLFAVGMYPAYRSLQSVLNPIRKDVRSARDCLAKPTGCSIPDSYRIATALQVDREKAKTKRFWFAMFLRGTESNDLFTTLAGVQRKVYLEGVVQPLLADTEARMTALDWTTFTPQYKAFREALNSMLAWRAVKTKAEGDGTPLEKPENLRLTDIVAFERQARNTKGGERSAEIDTWISALPANDEGPNKNLEGALRSDAEMGISVASPVGPIAKFDEYWTVQNLARWDSTLINHLKSYMTLYETMAATPPSDPPIYLASVVKTGIQFKENYEATTKHMGTPRPGEAGFPGAGPEQWTKNFQSEYRTLMHWEPASQGKISQKRGAEIEQALRDDWGLLQQQNTQYAYLLDPGQPKKWAWSKPAEALGGTLNALTVYSDLDAFRASEDGRPLESLASSSDATENAKKIDDWRKKQEGAQQDILTKSNPLATMGVAQFEWPTRSGFVKQTSELALLWRTLPPSAGYFRKVLVDECQSGACFQPQFAEQMIGSASATVAMASRQTSAVAFNAVAVNELIKTVGEPEVTYLRNYINRMVGRGPTGAGDFNFPASAASASSWSGFQAAIRAWSPQGGGGGAVAAETAGQLTDAQVQKFAMQNQRFINPVYEDYLRMIARPRAAASARATAPAELLEASNTFRQTVSQLPDQPLPAWVRLARGEGGSPPLLKQYKVFTDNPKLSLNQTAVRMKKEVADHGAQLMRDAIHTPYVEEEAGIWKGLQSCCLSKFPLINERELRQQQNQFADGTIYTRSGGAGTGMVGYRVSLPTMSSSDISGVIGELGNLATKYALDPIFAGEAPEFDFVGEHLPILSVAGLWERFLYGPPGQTQPREVKIEIKAIERPLPSGVTFLGTGIGQITFFDSSQFFRPSTDLKSPRQLPPFVWRLGSADTPLSIIGKNEDARGWSSRLDIEGGPLKLFYYVLSTTEERTPTQDRRVWNIRVEIPDGEHAGGRLEGVFQLKFEDPLPGVINPR